MNNTLPANRGLLSGLGEKIKMGLAALAVTLGITQITEAGFGVILTAFNDTLGVYNAARGKRQSAANLVKSTRKELYDWLKMVRGIFLGDFGNQWNQQWASAGFVQPHTAVPQRLQDQLSLALQIAKFFTANPSYEIPAKDVTATKGGAAQGGAGRGGSAANRGSGADDGGEKPRYGADYADG